MSPNKSIHNPEKPKCLCAVLNITRTFICTQLCPRIRFPEALSLYFAQKPLSFRRIVVAFPRACP